MNACSIDGCDKPRSARGWCKQHYMSWWHHGDPLAKPPGRWAYNVRWVCAVESCCDDAYKRGLCRSHYSRLRAVRVLAW